jgi:uncharacterized protein (TIGR00369 family)
MAITPRNENYEAVIREIFSRAQFIEELGIKLVRVAPGEAETSLEIHDAHRQQDGFVHAGVQATIADHTGGAAAATLFAEGQYPLSAEFKINFLRVADGTSLMCRSRVLKPGKTLSVVESEVYSVGESDEKLVSKATLTIAIVEPGANSI